MTDSSPKFKGKYRIASNRLKGWDYGAPGYYFVTICTKNQVPWFGEIKGGEMFLSELGMIIEKELETTVQIRPNVSLDAWVVMPNHVHAILIIREENRESVETPHLSIETPHLSVETPHLPVETPHLSVETPRWGVSNTNRNWRPGTLGAIINQYKSKCTKRIHAMGRNDFAWQTRYYDHIIRNEKTLESIRSYILGNPIKWTEDEYFLIINRC
jgi:putative transposase